MKKLFEEILLEYRCNVKESYAWVAEELRHWRGRIRMKKVPQIAQWQVPRRKLKHLPTSLPYCLSWQTSDLGLSEWGTYNWSLKLYKNSSFSSEQLKLVAWLDLASQDQVTAASRWAPSSQSVDCSEFFWQKLHQRLPQGFTGVANPCIRSMDTSCQHLGTGKITLVSYDF